MFERFWERTDDSTRRLSLARAPSMTRAMDVNGPSTSHARAHPSDGAFVTFLSTLKDDSLDELYESSVWAVLAALRACDAIGKQIVLRLSFVSGGSIAGAELERWIADGDAGRRATARALGRLSRVRAIERVVDGGEAREANAMEVDVGTRGRDFEEDLERGSFVGTIRVRPAFAAHVRRALERGFVGLDADGGGAEGGDDVVELEVEKKVPDRATLSAYAKSKWEDLLLTLTGASDAFSKPGSKVSGRLDAQALFRAAGLTTSDASGDKKARKRNAGVTAEGFRFLLTTAQEQVWVLLTQYIRDESRTASATSAISFLLRLTFQRPGRAYAMTGVLSDTEQDVVRDLTHLGLLYTFDVKKRWYYVPTLLSSGLSGGFASDDGDNRAMVSAEGHVIVETNYRVYAYTSSLVEMEILRLFTRADYRLPNLYVGMLTRESVQNALRAGVDAEQIVAYLRAHAHKQVRKKKPSVPGTVCDQIRLWARDMMRVQSDECVLYCDFPPVGGFYNAVVAEATKRGALLWRDDIGRKLTVRADAHEAMKPVVAALKQSLGDT